ncbi:hypothetical protein [Pseudomonas sp. Fl4BN1]|uniref:hypothetical protein n=1 Tax=Pseudomonas sp. Fl4BN1 TaxID=2697651 RepID=UPI0013790ED6|nr:hypothetical protein [Pseudomonas sp. Fl4BN1]NBF09540.1 hypothetical protein [Pseudomonas sp. Fl4BN1]
MGNMFRKGQAAVVGIFSGKDPIRFFSLLLAAYLGVNASTMHSSAAPSYTAVMPEYTRMALPSPVDSSLTLDAEPVMGRIALPSRAQQSVQRWVF